MMATVSLGSPPTEAFRRFRSLADAGRVPAGARRDGHRDGWGIACFEDGVPRYVGRSVRDASIDDAYGAALDALVAAPPTGIVLAHLRRASQGAIVLENAQPFLAGGFAFCHNGTIRGLARDGESDTRVFFERILAASRVQSIPDAIREVATALRRDHVCTSLTSMLTDGHTLWALRAIGNDPIACAPEACPEAYFTLGYGWIGDAVCVAQEDPGLPLEKGAWASIPDGSLLEVAPGCRPVVRPLRS